MPPKVARRPAAPAHLRVRRGALRRPAAAEEVAEEDPDKLWRDGREVTAGLVPPGLLAMEKKVIISKATYWEEALKVAGELKGIHMTDMGIVLDLDPKGTDCEAVIRWRGAHPGDFLQVHLCPRDCPTLHRDGVIHATQLRRWVDGEELPWMSNLVEARTAAPPGLDEMAALRERGRVLAAQDGRVQGPPPQGEGEKDRVVESSSEDTKEKQDKRKKKKKKKKKKEKVKVAGTKPLEGVFGSTCLDPSPSVRKGLKRRAKKLVRRKTDREASSGSSSTTDPSSDSSGDGRGGSLFGEEVRVKRVAARYPGALTLSTLEFMLGVVVQQTGQPWEVEKSSIPPVFLQYWRLALAPHLSGPMHRETHTLAYIQDLLLQGRVASATDVITQRLKSLQQTSQGAHYTVAQRQEIVPLDQATMSSPVETLEASKIQREEAKAKAAASRPWERRADWDNKRPEEHKGKGKGKDSGKGKGRSKADQNDKSKEEQRKGK